MITQLLTKKVFLIKMIKALYQEFYQVCPRTELLSQ